MSEEDKREAGSPARGGARTGAGRPKGSGTYSEVRSVRLRPDEAEHCRRKGGNRYLRGLIRADMTREEAPEGEDRPADVLPREHLNVRVVGRVPLETDPKDNVTRVEMKGSCGFPSPADDYASEEFNLNDFFVRKPHTGSPRATFCSSTARRSPSTATSCSPISAARSRSSASSALTASLS